jgi:hypothetical protein
LEKIRLRRFFRDPAHFPATIIVARNRVPQFLGVARSI